MNLFESLVVNMDILLLADGVTLRVDLDAMSFIYVFIQKTQEVASTAANIKDPELSVFLIIQAFKNATLFLLEREPVEPFKRDLDPSQFLRFIVIVFRVILLVIGIIYDNIGQEKNSALSATVELKVILSIKDMPSMHITGIELFYGVLCITKGTFHKDLKFLEYKFFDKKLKLADIVYFSF